MSIQISTIHWLRGLFEEWHWSRLPTPQAVRRFNLILMADPERTAAAVLVDAIHLRPPRLDGRDLTEQFDEWLRRFQASLDGLRERDIPVQRLFFTGGGPISLPSWFRQACEARGIRIHTVSTDEPPPGLDAFMDRP